MPNLEYINCAICGNNHTDYFLIGRDMWHNIDSEFTIVRCKKCNLVYINPRLSTLDISKFYPEDYIPYIGDVRVVYNFEETIIHKMREIIFESFLQGKATTQSIPIIVRFCLRLFQRIRSYKSCPLNFSGRKRKILDIGCSIGEFLEFMNSRSWETYGIEPNSKAIEICERKGLNVVQGLFNVSTHQKISFDVVTLWQVFEHIPNPGEVLCGIKATLKDDGILIMSLPNIRSIPAFIFHKYWFNADIPRHCLLYSPKTIAKVLHQAGYKLVRVYFLSSTAGFTGSIEFILREKFGFKIKRNKIRKNKLLCYLFLPLVRLIDILGLGDNMYVIAKKYE